jgi:AcrR family transcriptional regulator
LQQELTTRRHDLIRLAATVFSQRGYRGTTMRHIADAAGILPGSLYHHFASKEEILREVMEQSTADFVARLEEIAATDAPAGERIRTAMRERLELYGERGTALDVVLQTDKTAIQLPAFDAMRALGHRIDRAFDRMVTSGIEGGEFRKDLDVRAASYAIIGMLNWAHRWFNPAGRLSPAELADQWAALVIAGMKAPAATARLLVADGSGARL